MMQTMVITLADTSKLKRLQTCNQATAFPSISAISFSGKYRGCSSLQRDLSSASSAPRVRATGIRRVLLGGGGVASTVAGCPRMQEFLFGVFATAAVGPLQFITN